MLAQLTRVREIGTPAGVGRMRGWQFGILMCAALAGPGRAGAGEGGQAVTDGRLRVEYVGKGNLRQPSADVGLRLRLTRTGQIQAGPDVPLPMTGELVARRPADRSTGPRFGCGRAATFFLPASAARVTIRPRTSPNLRLAPRTPRAPRAPPDSPPRRPRPGLGGRIRAKSRP